MSVCPLRFHSSAHATSRQAPNLPQFEYKSIAGDTEIRILVLQPASNFSDPIVTAVCTRLILPYLDSTESESPRYAAVSHCWGTSNDSKWINCDNRRMRVSSQVETILRYLRKVSRPRYLWIDAICINQSDDEEKAKQVQCMGQIYTQADKVHVWLGEAADEDRIEDVYDSLREIARTSNHRYAPSRSPVSLSYKAVDSLSAFLSRPWFSRRWALQEVALAADVTVHCGRHKISWEWIRDALSSLHQRSEDENENGVDLMPIITSKFVVEGPETLYSHHRNILDLLWSCHSTDCTDERDRLFALYGLRPFMPSHQTMLHQINISELCPVTYSRHWADVYTEFAKTMIDEGHGNTIMQHALAFGNLSQQNEAWPSWVPSWNQRRKSSAWTASNVHGRYPDAAFPSQLFTNAIVKEFYLYGRCRFVSDNREPTISQCHALLERLSRRIPKNGKIRLMMAQMLSKAIKDAGSTLHRSNHRANDILDSPTPSEPDDCRYSALEVYDVVERTCQREFGCMEYLKYEDRRVLGQEKFRTEVNRLTAGCTVCCFETASDIVFGLTPAAIQKGDMLCCQFEELLWEGSFGTVLRPQRTTAFSVETNFPAFRLVGGCTANYPEAAVPDGEQLSEEVIIF